VIETKIRKLFDLIERNKSLLLAHVPPKRYLDHLTDAQGKYVLPFDSP